MSGELNVILLIFGIVLLFSAASIIFHFLDKSDDKFVFKGEVLKFKKDYNTMIANMNKYLSNTYPVNDSYLKEELISILHRIDHNLLTSDINDEIAFKKLILNKDLITNLFLDWVRISTETKNIFNMKKAKDSTISKLLSEYNAGSSKYAHIKSKYPKKLNILNFIPDKKYYEKYYFDRIEWLIDESYKALCQCNYIKSLILKEQFNLFLEETKKVLKEPSNILQDIHDIGFRIKKIEDDFSLHKSSTFSKLKAEFDGEKNIELSPASRIKYEELKDMREDYYRTTKWSNDKDQIEEEVLSIRRHMIDLVSRVKNDKERVENLRNKLRETKAVSFEEVIY